jgi:hypothetical protein
MFNSYLVFINHSRLFLRERLHFFRGIMKQQRRQHLFRWAVTTALFLGAFALVFFLEVDYQRVYDADAYSNAFFVAGCFILAIPLFILIERSGVFDVFNFSFYRLFESFRADKKKRWDTAYDYQEYQKEHRHLTHPYLLPFWVEAGVGLVSALICLLIFQAQIGH